MPDPVFNAQHYVPDNYRETYTDEDFPTEEEAKAAVEKAGGGRVVKFAAYYNLPGCLPEIRLSSIWMKVYENGEWRDCNIHC